MRRFWNGNGRGKICLPIVERSLAGARGALARANPLADLIELRMDFLHDRRLAPLLDASERPLIVTNRRAEEGGRFRGREEKRFETLQEGIELGAEFVDVELGSKPSLLRDLMNHRKRTRLILSFHDFEKTPRRRELESLLARMMELGPEVVKIVTLARNMEDNVSILSFLSSARKQKQIVVAFCMGEKGKMSRVFAPLMGSAWTYACLDKGRTSAPGQLTAIEMREIWERLG